MRAFIKPRGITLKIFFILFCIIITPFYSALKAQNIAITDDDSYTASPSAMLDVKSTTKGLLIPRLTTIQREAINPVATGLLVFDINKNAFYYYDGTEWLALPQVSSSTAISEALFAVKNSAGDTIFAVYNDGVKVVVPYGTKGKVGGFAVSGRSPTKAGEEEYLLVTPDSTRVFINEVDVKGKVGGFAVSGRSPTKSILKDYFISTSDSTRIYVPEGLFKGKVGGFAVSGRSPTKLGEPNDYFNISGNLQAEKINNESRVMWYPVKAAFLAGEVHVGSADSVGTNSTSLGYRTIAMGNYSQAMGYKAQSLGLNSTAIGNYAIASAENSFALGDSAIARGVGSYAFGTTGLDTTSGTPTTVQTIANGDHSFAFGFGSYAHSIGGVAIGTDAASIGKFSMAFGLNDTAYADFSYALGVNSISSGKYSFTIGVGNQATKRGAYAIGNECIASGQTSFSMGYQSVASGLSCFAIGYQDTASFGSSIAMGFNTNATNAFATSFGAGTEASGVSSTAFGNLTKATDWFATSFGASTVASGHTSTAFGNNTTASGMYSIAMGNKIIVSGHNSVGIGLSDTQYTLSQNNSMAIIGGFVGINTVTPAYSLDVYGNIRATEMVYANANGAPYFRGGDDSELWDVNVANTLAIYGRQNSAIATLRLGSGAADISGSSGNIGIGTISPTYKLDVAGPINISKGWSESIALSVNGVEAIWSNGTNFNWGAGGLLNYFSDIVSIGTTDNTYMLNVKSDIQVMRIWKDADGTLIRFATGASVASNKGSISVTGETVTYNAFTGSHYARTEGTPEKGLLVSLTGNNSYIDNNPNSEIIYGAIISNQPNSKNILGAYLGKLDPDEKDSYDLVMAVGNGVIWVVDNGENLKIGDYLISSSIAGHAMKDNDNYEISYIIGRVAEPVDWSIENLYIDGVKHKLISVFFENFKIDKSNYKMSLELEKLKTDFLELKKEIELLKNK